MIARYFILFMLIHIIADVYIHYYILRKNKKIKQIHKILWWIPTVLFLFFTIKLSLSNSFVTDNQSHLFSYFFCFGVITIPKLLFIICHFIGKIIKKYFKLKRNFGVYAGVFLAIIAIYVTIYGTFFGVKEIEIKQINLEFSELPNAFDGYRIVLFSDLHIGSYNDWRHKLLARNLNLINKQKGDLIIFAGDIQNTNTHEIMPNMQLLQQLKAKDGIISVLGNHDYSQYVKVNKQQAAQNKLNMIAIQKKIGWNLLLNEHKTIYRNGDSIVIGGMENDGKAPFPAVSNIKNTLNGVKNNAFIIMVQHDPLSWKRTILPQSNAQLTLSGHTHAGQIQLFGFTPVKLLNPELQGLYSEGQRKLLVSNGIGALLPIRFGATADIMVITLRKSKNK